MAKKIQGLIRLQLPAGAANPAPPVGPALGAQGVNIMAFCKEFNAKTKDQNGMILPVVITVFSDKSFTFILKSPPASVLLKKAANIASGSGKPNQDNDLQLSEFRGGGVFKGHVMVGAARVQPRLMRMWFLGGSDRKSWVAPLL